MKFEKREFKNGEEQRLKEEIFDMNMNPREWMARFGHNILAGDMRRWEYQDKEFEIWIHKAFDALANEGLKKLWNEFLTDKEIEVVKKAYENP